MAEAETIKVDTIVESELDARVKKLEDRLTADVLAFSGRITYGTDLVIRDAVEWRKTADAKKKKACLLFGNARWLYRNCTAYCDHSQEALSNR
ncbi:hypothetical protein ES703_54549 [subsurface metagenome]